jgi:ribosome-binding protein aMBF1 (putative translation factor)
MLGVPLHVLATAAHLSNRQLMRIEAGECLPTRETAKDIDDAFEVILMERAAEGIKQALKAATP